MDNQSGSVTVRLRLKIGNNFDGVVCVSFEFSEEWATFTINLKRTRAFRFWGSVGGFAYSTGKKPFLIWGWVLLTGSTD